MKIEENGMFYGKDRIHYYCNTSDIERGSRSGGFLFPFSPFMGFSKRTTILISG